MCQNNCILKLFDKVVYVCYAFWPREKRYRLEIWYGHSPRSYLKTSFFLFFQKSDSEGRWPRTTAASRGYTAYVLDCLVFLPERFCLTEHTLDGTVGVWALTLDLAGFG